MVIDEQALSELDAGQLRHVSQRLLAELRNQRALNEKLAYACALLKRLKFAARSERPAPSSATCWKKSSTATWRPFSTRSSHRRPTQPVTGKQQLKHTPLPANLPRREIRHEPTSTT